MTVARHNLRDIPFVEHELEINITSPFIVFRVNGKPVDAHSFMMAGVGTTYGLLQSTIGDALPLRSGKFWNLMLEYVLSPPTLYIKGVTETAMINLFEVEEYACVTSSDLRELLHGQTSNIIGDAALGYRAYHVRYEGDEDVSLVVQGPVEGPGCMRFLGIWQHQIASQ